MFNFDGHEIRKALTICVHTEQLSLTIEDANIQSHTGIYVYTVYVG